MKWISGGNYAELSRFYNDKYDEKNGDWDTIDSILHDLICSDSSIRSPYRLNYGDPKVLAGIEIEEPHWEWDDIKLSKWAKDLIKNSNVGEMID